jgi:hypothetical protein
MRGNELLWSLYILFYLLYTSNFLRLVNQSCCTHKRSILAKASSQSNREVAVEICLWNIKPCGGETSRKGSFQPCWSVLSGDWPVGQGSHRKWVDRYILPLADSLRRILYIVTIHSTSIRGSALSLLFNFTPMSVWRFSLMLAVWTGSKDQRLVASWASLIARLSSK